MLRFEGQYTVLSQNRLSTSTTATKVEKMTLYIAHNYTECLTAKEIAEEAGVTPDYANAIFKKAFGHSLMRLFLSIRVYDQIIENCLWDIGNR